MNQSINDRFDNLSSGKRKHAVRIDICSRDKPCAANKARSKEMTIIVLQAKEKGFEMIKIRTFIPNSDEHDFRNIQLRRAHSQTFVTVFQKLPIGCFNFLKKAINHAE